MVDFGGFALPVQYSSIIEEHAAVREAAGLFDVSHMGQIELSGAESISAADRLFSQNVASLAIGRACYGLMCNDDGGVVDDLIAYRIAEDSMFWCVNAANVEKVHRWILAHSPPEIQVRNASNETGLLALQGPASEAILSHVASKAATGLGRYRFATAEVAGCSATVSRTGYTGEDGFEIYLAASDTPRVFEALLEAGKSLGVQPAGLGARDTLRLEAALPLYGHELDDTTSPLDAGLERFVDLARGGFIGADAIARRRDSGQERRLVGFVLDERGVARAGYTLTRESEPIGTVTSGAPSPTLGKSIGLAYVPPHCSEPGSSFEVVIRNRAVPAHVVETPFI
jgi:aminomethyltransferase